MFDVGFWELVMIGVVALLVIGPERLPKVARTAGLWVGRARRMLTSVKADIDRELHAEELKRIMAEQARSSGVHEIVEETRESLEDLGKPQPLPPPAGADASADTDGASSSSPEDHVQKQ